ncbi:MAG: hypothetical protein ACI9CA_002418, partial [Natronomonas sp.]
GQKAGDWRTRLTVVTGDSAATASTLDLLSILQLYDVAL